MPDIMEGIISTLALGSATVGIAWAIVAGYLP